MSRRDAIGPDRLGRAALVALASGELPGIALAGDLRGHGLEPGPCPACGRGSFGSPAAPGLRLDVLFREPGYVIVTHLCGGARPCRRATPTPTV